MDTNEVFYFIKLIFFSFLFFNLNYACYLRRYLECMEQRKSCTIKGRISGRPACQVLNSFEITINQSINHLLSTAFSILSPLMMLFHFILLLEKSFARNVTNPTYSSEHGPSIYTKRFLLFLLSSVYKLLLLGPCRWKPCIF